MKDSPSPKRDPNQRGDSFRFHHKIDKLHFLKRCPLFSQLSEWQIRSVAKFARLVEVRVHEFVFKAAEESAAFYVVASGRLEVSIDSEGQKKVVAYFKQGSHFGEMSLLTGQVHSASVRAISDSLLLEISKEDFLQIVANNSQVALELSRSLSNRLRHENEASGVRSRRLHKSDVVAVFNLRRESEFASFSVNLAASLTAETGQEAVLVNMIRADGKSVSEQTGMADAPEIHPEDPAHDIEHVLSTHMTPHDSGIKILNLPLQSGFSAMEASWILHLLNQLTVDFRFVVLNLPFEAESFLFQLTASCDWLFLVAEDNQQEWPEVESLTLRIRRNSPTIVDKTKLVLFASILNAPMEPARLSSLFSHTDIFRLPQASVAWFGFRDRGEILSIQHPDAVFSVRMRRIARFVSRNLVGLALGSGAALGFAHIGVLRVLEREKIPIDYISGSSMGALIAAFYATGLSPDDMQKVAEDEMSIAKLLALADVSVIPLRGLIKGKRIEGLLKRYLKEARFEDARIPLLIVGASIQDRAIRVMNTGSILDAVRASIAIPGIFYPVRQGDEVLIDGGVLDPLPIRPLQDQGVHKIIAVDVLPTPDDIMLQHRHASRLRATRDALVAKKGIFPRLLHRARKALGRILMPNFIDIVVNSMQAMEHVIADSASSDADVLIRPSMPLIHWVEFHRAKELIRKGEEAAEFALEDIRNLLKHQNY